MLELREGVAQICSASGGGGGRKFSTKIEPTLDPVSGDQWRDSFKKTGVLFS